MHTATTDIPVIPLPPAGPATHRLLVDIRCEQVLDHINVAIQCSREEGAPALLHRHAQAPGQYAAGSGRGRQGGGGGGGGAGRQAAGRWEGGRRADERQAGRQADGRH